MQKQVTLTINDRKLQAILTKLEEGYNVQFFYGDNEFTKHCKEWIDVVLITQQMIMQFCLYAGVKLKFRH